MATTVAQLRPKSSRVLLPSRAVLPLPFVPCPALPWRRKATMQGAGLDGWWGVAVRGWWPKLQSSSTSISASPPPVGSLWVSECRNSGSSSAMLLASCGCLALQQLCRVLCHAIIQQPLVERARRRIRSLLLLFPVSLSL
jgi:hypothetical protein